MMDNQPEQNPENEITPEQKLLKELVKLQKQRNLDLAEFKKLINLLYVFLIVGIILGIMVAFYMISGGKL
jgi:hypothetical protein